MKTIHPSLGIILLLTISFAKLALASEPESVPPIQIEEAIRKAREYVKTHEIDVSKRHISSAKFRKNEDENPYWFITWGLDENYGAELQTLGGQVFLSVFIDGRIVVTYGE